MIWCNREGSMIMMTDLVAVYIILQVPFSSACATRGEPNQGLVTGQANIASPMTKSMDPELARLIKTFSEDRGENGQAAWEKLQSYPHNHLIDSLLRIREDLTEDSPMQLSVAFVLCNMNYEYSTNVQIIVSALTKIPHSMNYYADNAEAMLSRLIHRGDKALLQVLFSAVPWSDGALTEGLSDTFSDELRSDPREFLSQLKKTHEATRLKVYKQIRSGSLTADDVKRLRGQVKSLARTGPISQVAKEILSSPALKQ